MFDQTLYIDVIYTLLMSVTAVLLLWWTVRKVISVNGVYLKRAEDKKEFNESLAIRTGIVILCAWVGYILFATLAWNLKKDMFPREEITNPAEQEAIEKSLQHEAASAEELTQNKKELIEERDVKPHEEAISSFEQKMEREAEKIRKRNNLDQPNEPNN